MVNVDFDPLMTWMRCRLSGFSTVKLTLTQCLSMLPSCEGGHYAQPTLEEQGAAPRLLRVEYGQRSFGILLTDLYLLSHLFIQ